MEINLPLETLRHSIEQRQKDLTKAKAKLSQIQTSSNQVHTKLRQLVDLQSDFKFLQRGTATTRVSVVLLEDQLLNVLDSSQTIEQKEHLSRKLSPSPSGISVKDKIFPHTEVHRPSCVQSPTIKSKFLQRFQTVKSQSPNTHTSSKSTLPDLPSTPESYKLPQIKKHGQVNQSVALPPKETCVELVNRLMPLQDYKCRQQRINDFVSQFRLDEETKVRRKMRKKGLSVELNKIIKRKSIEQMLMSEVQNVVTYGSSDYHQLPVVDQARIYLLGAHNQDRLLKVQQSAKLRTTLRACLANRIEAEQISLKRNQNLLD